MEQELNIKEEVQDYDYEPNEDLEDRKLIIPKIKREVDTFEDDIVDEEFEDEEPYDEQDLEESSDEYSENDSDSDYKEKKSKSKSASKSPGILCLGCDRTFKSQPNLNKHLGHFSSCRQLYEESGSLPNCFSQPKKRTTGEDGDFQCEKCYKKFASEGGLNR